MGNFVDTALALLEAGEDTSGRLHQVRRDGMTASSLMLRATSASHAASEPSWALHPGSALPRRILTMSEEIDRLKRLTARQDGLIVRPGPTVRGRGPA